MKRSVYIVLGVAALAALIFTARTCALPPSTRNQWHTVTTTTEARVLYEVGLLEAREIVRLVANTSGAITQLAEDGTRVEQGQLILEQDREELESRLEDAIESLDQYREDMNALHSEIEILKSSFAINTRVKEIELQHATLELELGLNPLTEVDKRLLEIEKELGKLDVARKTADLERQRDLVRQNFAPASSLDQLELELSAATIYLEEKISQIQMASQPIPKEEQLTLEAAWEKARKNLSRNQAQQALQLRIKDLQLKDLELEISPKELEIKRLRDELNGIQVLAPAEGLVRLIQTYDQSARAWRPRSIGQNVWKLDAVATIVDPDDLYVRVMLHESDVGEVQVGDPVTAELTAFPDERLSGTITYVAEVGQDRDDLSPLHRQAQPIEQALFLVMIDLDASASRAMPGMTANVRIEVEPARPRVLIPGSALISSTPPYAVILDRKGKEHRQELEGRFDRLGRFEVTSGLTEGDRIKLSGGPDNG